MLVSALSTNRGILKNIIARPSFAPDSVDIRFRIALGIFFLALSPVTMAEATTGSVGVIIAPIIKAIHISVPNSKYTIAALAANIITIITKMYMNILKKNFFKNFFGILNATPISEIAKVIRVVSSKREEFSFQEPNSISPVTSGPIKTPAKTAIKGTDMNHLFFNLLLKFPIPSTNMLSTIMKI